MDKIDRVQENNLMPFEQQKKDALNDRATSIPKNVDDVGISREWWMVDFRTQWLTEYPKTEETMSEELWKTWYKNFSVFTRQDINYAFNEVRKTPRDYGGPNLSHLFNTLMQNGQKRIRMDDVGKVESACKDKTVGQCVFGDPYWQLNKYGTHDFRLLCVMECDKSTKSYPNDFQKKQKPEPKTKGEWFVMVASYMGNDDSIIIEGTNKTGKDRKFETYQYGELFPDGNIKEVLKSYGLNENSTFIEQCMAISELSRTKSIGTDVL